MVKNQTPRLTGAAFFWDDRFWAVFFRAVLPRLAYHRFADHHGDLVASASLAPRLAA
jgi:hypothetical protein